MIVTEYYGPRSSPENNKIVGDFVSSVVWGSPEKVADFCSMAVVMDGKLIAGTLYHNWHPDEGVIELTSGALTRKWLTKSVINAMFSLPFDTLGCQMCVLRVSERNTGMLEIARRFGFTEYFIPRLRGREEGEFIFTLTDDQWRSSKYRS